MTTIVEAAWHEMLATAGAPSLPTGSPQLEPFVELVRVAYDEPLLRQLYPWTGMWELHFSRCTESRYTWDIPYIRTLRDGRYCVEGPSRSSLRIAETDSAQAAIAAVVDRLPPHCGPAFIGSAEELDAYDEAQGSKRAFRCNGGGDMSREKL